MATLSNVDHSEPRSERLTRLFVSHMLRGNIRAALALLDTMDHPGAPLRLSDPASPDTPSWTVLDELKAKHPCSQRKHCSLHLQPLPLFIQLCLMP